MGDGNFWFGITAGVAVGTFLGMRMKANERKIRRTLNRTARNVESAFDHMSR